MNADRPETFYDLANIGRTEWWLIIVTVLLTVIGYTVGQLPLTFVQLSAMNSDPNITTNTLLEFSNTMDFSLFHISNNFGLILMICFFLFATLGLWIGLRLHQRSLKDIITPRLKINYKKIFWGFGFWFVLTLIFETIVYFIDPSNYIWSFDISNWGILLLISIFFLPIQTSLEEFLFRGYLMPWMGQLLKNKWMPIIITSILFSLVHSANPEIDKFGFWTMQFYYIGAGLFLGYITVMDNSLELALGVHAATNIFGTLMVSYAGGVLQTDSILKATEINPWIMIIAFYISAAIFIIYFSKKYSWPPIQSLFEPITTQSSTPSDHTLTDEIVDFTSLKNDHNNENNI